jgi:hypothetical protein
MSAIKCTAIAGAKIPDSKLAKQATELTACGFSACLNCNDGHQICCSGA